MINELQNSIRGLYYFFDKKNTFFKWIFYILIYFLINKYKTGIYLTKELYIFLVIIILSECINTIFEHLCDYINPNFDKKIGIIKDMASSVSFLGIIFYFLHLIIFI